MPNTAVAPLDNVQQFFAPIASKQDVSVQALVGVVVERMTTSKGGQAPTAKELIEYASLCKQAGLNPTTSEVAPLVQGGKVSLIISVDGWMKVARSYPEFAGYKLVPSDEMVKVGVHEVPAFITSQIYIKGFEMPLEWRTYYHEVVKAKSPVWQQQPNHMMQVRALANGIKRAFGLTAYTPDEADTIRENNQLSAQVYPDINTSKGRAKVLNAVEMKQPRILEETISDAELVSANNADDIPQDVPF